MSIAISSVLRHFIKDSGHALEKLLAREFGDAGIRNSVARNTLANANAVRDWRIHAELAQSLIGIARPLYAEEPFGVDLKNAVYALDASTIDLCLSVFPWAPFRSTKAAIKLHTLLDLCYVRRYGRNSGVFNAAMNQADRKNAA